MKNIPYRQADFLVPGDCIGIVAPARKVAPHEVHAAISLIEKNGFRWKLSKNLYATDNQFAGEDRLRAFDLQQMIDDDEVKAVFCARGGYGTLRIIDAIDFRKFAVSPKWICGFSDVTVLHSHLHQNLGMQSIHSAMPLTFPQDGDENEAVKQLFAMLTGKTQQLCFPPHPLNRMGHANGVLTGGNLSILYCLAGSASDVNTDGKILFIEDLDEYLYHIDRMMISLKRAGKLTHLKALLVGGMNDMRDNTVPFGKNAEEIIADCVKDYAYPVLFNLPAGHIPDNLPLMFGAAIEIWAGPQDAGLRFV
jgi:muramoyltetrapeptide carboxypeptidase